MLPSPADRLALPHTPRNILADRKRYDQPRNVCPAAVDQSTAPSGVNRSLALA
jgi:hypothetical protein